MLSTLSIHIPKEVAQGIAKTDCFTPYQEKTEDGVFYYCNNGFPARIGFRSTATNCDTYLNLVTGESQFFGADKICQKEGYKHFENDFDDQQIKKLVKHFGLKIGNRRNRKH